MVEDAQRRGREGQTHGSGGGCRARRGGAVGSTVEDERFTAGSATKSSQATRSRVFSKRTTTTTTRTSGLDLDLVAEEARENNNNNNSNNNNNNNKNNNNRSYENNTTTTPGPTRTDIPPTTPSRYGSLRSRSPFTRINNNNNDNNNNKKKEEEQTIDTKKDGRGGTYDVIVPSPVTSPNSLSDSWGVTLATVTEAEANSSGNSFSASFAAESIDKHHHVLSAMTPSSSDATSSYPTTRYEP